MKYLLNLLFCVVWIAACDDDQTTQTSHQPFVHTIRLQAAVEPLDRSRTQLGGDGVTTQWAEGDRIGLFVRCGDAFTTRNAPMSYEGATAATQGIFTGDVTLLRGVSSYTIYAYYPYREHAGLTPEMLHMTLPTQQTQAASGSSNHLGGSDVLICGEVSSCSFEFPTLRFRHAFAVAEVTLMASGAAVGERLASVALFSTDASSVSPDGSLTELANLSGEFSFDLLAGASNNRPIYRGGSAQIGYVVLHLAEPPVLGGEPITAYVTINAADYSRGNGSLYLVARTTSGATATLRYPGQVVGAGERVVLDAAIGALERPLPAVDLSLAGEHANCYIASRPMQAYSFDATVAGNGVVPEALAQAVQRFEGRTLSTAVSGTTTRLLWQSHPYLIEPGSLVCESGRIRFRLTERPTELGGNAVIGLFANSDPQAEALWSWHVWITDQSNDELVARAEPYLLYADYEEAYGVGSVKMMDRNLGAIYNADDAYARSFRAPLYQWGRKDPFPWGLVVYDARSVAYRYLPNRPPVVATGALGQWSGYTGNTAYATAHPDTFIATSNQSSFDWYYGGGRGTGSAVRNNALWGNPLGYEVGQPTVKTLFDPCPAGWVMPHAYAFSGFTKSGATAPANSIYAAISGNFVQGWNFYYDRNHTTYYPGVGFRFDEFGSFGFAPSAYYWSSSPAPDGGFGAWIFGMTAAQIYQRVADPRGFGLPVRCMRDGVMR